MSLLRQCRPLSSLYQKQSISNRIRHYQQLQQHRSVLISSTLPNHLNLPDDVAELVYKYAHEPQTSVSLSTLLRTGRGEHLPTKTQDEKEVSQKVLLQIASFLHHEFPIRLAHRIQDLDRAPLMRDMPSVQSVKETYVNTFMDYVSFPTIDTMEKEEDFYRLLQASVERHSSVLIHMARGAFELREAIRKGEVKDVTRGDNVISFEKMDTTHEFLDRFYMARIGMRVLAGHYICLHQPTIPNYIGLINQKTSPYDIVMAAAEDASLICTRKYGDAPEVEITGRSDLNFPYIPDHLHYILLELIKNSMRATVDFHGVDNDFPPIQVIIADGNDNEDVVIKVEDKGGGIPRSDMKKIWSYLFTTADPAVQEGMVAFNSKVDHSVDSPLAGLGYGLPISRSYARYFGGDLSVMSMEGYGTDAFVYLVRLGNTKEPLPL